MVVRHVRKPSNFLYTVLSGGSCSEYLATAVFVEEVDSLFYSFNGGQMFTHGKHCVAHSAITVPI
jgi:hypothetical protein